MASVKKVVISILMLAILVAIATTLALFGLEAYLRLTDFGSKVFHQRCLNLAESEKKQSYVPNCSSVIFVNRKKVTYSFNEDGLRDRHRNQFRDNVILALGDSIIKGLSLQKEQAIPSLLDFRLKDKFNVQFLNAGIRLSSPVTQSLLATKLLDVYKIKRVILFLNGSDVADERLAYAMAEEFDVDGVPTRFRKDPFAARLSDSTARKMRLLSLESFALAFLTRVFRYESWKGELFQIPKSEKVLCGGIERLERILTNRKIPLMVAITPHPKSGIESTWAGVPYDPKDLATMKECAERGGARVVDLSTMEMNPSWYQEDGMHYRASGTLWVADQLEDAIAKWIGGREK